MFIRTLQPIRDKDSYSRELEKLLSYDLFQLIFKPLIDLLGPETKENSKSTVLSQAFTQRKVYFFDGFVYGKFNASISRALRELGAVFNNTKKAFKISLSQFPPELRATIAQATSAEKEAVKKVQKKLQELSVSKIVIPGTKEISEHTLEDLHRQFKKVTPEDLEIPVEMNDFQRNKILEDYTNNVQLSIKGLTEEVIESLRYRVEEEVGKGTRAEKLKEILMSQHGVAANRAKFIARQETSLFVSKYRQTRYEDAGFNQYEWSTSSDDRVRDDHKDLNGKIFSWDNPPITNKHTGERNNPGEDFGCRCVALPVIKDPKTGRNLLEVS